MEPSPLSDGNSGRCKKHELVQHASMEPSPLSDGNNAPPICTLPWQTELQWSRRLSATETPGYGPDPPPKKKLQWSRRLSATETSRVNGDHEHGLCGLQWSRRL